MATDAIKNFATSLVATAPSPATSGTSLVVTAGQGSRFPATPFNAIIAPADTLATPANAEIVTVTNISTDSFTITRTAESTSARTVVVGDRIFQGPTAKSFTDRDTAIAAKQDADAELSALAGLTSAADKLPYFTGSGTAAITDITSTARSLLDDTSTAAMLTTLGAQASDAELTAIAGLTSAADKLPYFTGSGTASTTDFTSAARTVLDDTTTGAMLTTLSAYSKSEVDFIVGNKADATALSTVAGLYKPVLVLPSVIIGAGTAQYTRRAVNLGAAPPVVVASGTANANLGLFQADAASMNLSGYTTKLKLRIIVSTNATAPTINFLGRLVTSTGSQGGADSHNYSWGSTDIATATVTAPAASSVVLADSSAVTLPADGTYFPTITISANMPATNPRVLVQLILLMAHV